MNPAWLTGGAAAVNSAVGLFGAISNRGLSQRDAMQAQSEFGLRHQREQLLNMPRYEVMGLKRAGINPMLPYAGGGSNAGVSGMTPGITAPVNPAADAAAAIQAGIATALEVAKTLADIDVKKEQAKLTSAQATTESERPALVRMETELTTARDMLARQDVAKRMIETAIAQQNLSVAEKDAVLAAIDLDLYSSGIGEISRTLQQLGFSPGGAAGAASALLKLFGVGQRKGR